MTPSLRPQGPKSAMLMVGPLVAASAASAYTIPDPTLRALLQLAAAMLCFLVGWVAPAPKEPPSRSAELERRLRAELDQLRAELAETRAQVPTVPPRPERHDHLKKG